MSISSLQEICELLLERDLAEVRAFGTKEKMIQDEVDGLRDALARYDRQDVDRAYTVTSERAWFTWAHTRILQLNQELALVRAQKLQAQQKAGRSLGRRTGVDAIAAKTNLDTARRMEKAEAEKHFLQGIYSKDRE